VVEVIKKLDSDIACFQEFDKSLVSDVQKINYQVIHSRRKEWFFMNEGLSIAYKSDKFDLISQTTIDLDELKDKMKSKDYEHGMIALFVKLRHKLTGAFISVINTHLLSKRDQMQVNFAECARLSTEIHKKLSKEDIIILCGDFNQTPTTCTL